MYDGLITALHMIAITLGLAWIVTIALSWEALGDQPQGSEPVDYLVVLAVTAPLGVVAAVCTVGAMIADIVVTRPQL